MSCLNCGSLFHEKWACTKPPKKSTAARMDVPVRSAEIEPRARKGATTDVTRVNTAAGTQALPVDTKATVAQSGEHRLVEVVGSKPTRGRSADRHKPGYQAQKQREYRARRAKMKEPK
jgi:hypothetical protein